MAVCTDGLNWDHWLICLGFACVSLLWGFILRFVPANICPESGNKEVDPFAHKEGSAAMLGIRSNTTSYQRRLSLKNL